MMVTQLRGTSAIRLSRDQRNCEKQVEKLVKTGGNAFQGVGSFSAERGLGLDDGRVISEFTSNC
eukprot:scaffold4675_cov179-Ochromonas_danica.AAC.2